MLFITFLNHSAQLTGLQQAKFVTVIGITSNLHAFNSHTSHYNTAMHLCIKDIIVMIDGYLNVNFLLVEQ